MPASPLARSALFFLALTRRTWTSHSFTFYGSRRPASSTHDRTSAALLMVKEVDKFSPRRAPPKDDDPTDVVPDDYDLTDNYGDSEEDWIPDRDKIRAAAREWSKRAEVEVEGESSSSSSRPNGRPDKARQYHSPVDHETAETVDDADDYFEGAATTTSGAGTSHDVKKPKSPFTEEEEELIEAMGGKFMESPSPKRESGFIGDSTLREIASDFQMPVCYLADVLCSWDVPVPIDVDVRLGDMVTGEMAFALVEAVHTLDAGELNDRYSCFDLMGLCHEYDIDLKDAFDFCVKEGWNLPFGVRTFLRVDQEDELVRGLSDDVIF